MSRLDPEYKKRWQRRVIVLYSVITVLLMVGTVLDAYPLPFRVPPVLMALPGGIALVLLVVATVLTVRGPRRR